LPPLTPIPNANNYYVIAVMPGTYTNDFPLVTRPMTIQTAAIGRAVVLNATEPLPNEKGIILNLSNLTVNGLTFQGAEISNALGGNGAGIRDQNVSTTTPYLIVMSSTFQNNQEGILTGYNSAQTITMPIQFSKIMAIPTSVISNMRSMSTTPGA
jgi:hypothetical protein